MLGNALINYLKVLGFTNLITPNRKELDLKDRKATLEYIKKNKPEIVVHLAAQVYGLGGNLRNQIGSIISNTLIDNNLFFALSKYLPKQIFYAGSVASYPYPFGNSPIKEDKFFMGLPHYGEFGYSCSKRHAYNYLKIFSSELSVDCTYGILTNLYGPNDKFDLDNGHVIPSLIMKTSIAKLNSEKLRVWGSGKAERQFLYSSDAADAIFLCLKNLKGLNLINISSGNKHSISEISEILSNHAKLSGIEYEIDKPEGILTRAFDISKIKNLGFKPKINLEFGLKKTYDWYVQEYKKNI